jgi:hypothetical protein
MSFRLIYEGQLLSSNSGNKQALKKNKHAIRKELHFQLKRLWEVEKSLQYIARSPIIGKKYSSDNPPNFKDEGLRYISKKYERSGYGFVPLVGVGYPGSEDPPVICSLDILFLRREPPGALVQGGDMDNRLNTLFDALRIPQDGEEITEAPSEEEKPFYCLLPDDRLISEVKVTTDLLLRPPRGIGQHEVNDVVLVIGVTIKEVSAVKWT